MENTTSITDLLHAQLLNLMAVLPALFKALVLLIIGVILARLLRRLVKRLVTMIGLDRFAAKLNDIDIIQRTGQEIKFSNILGSLVYYFIVLIFAMAAVEALGMQMISELMADLVDYIPKAITAFAILLFGIFVADALRKVIAAACQSLNISAGGLISNVVFYFIFLNVVLISLRQAEMQTEFMENNITVVLAGVAAAFAIGYGLASRDIMGNMLASFYNRGRLEVGDEVTIDGRRGEIVQLGTDAVVIRSETGESIIPFHEVSKNGAEIHSRRSSGGTTVSRDALPPNLG